MGFFREGINTIQTVLFLIAAGLTLWGVVNLLEGYGNDNPGAKSQGIKQSMAGIGIGLVAQLLVPQLSTLMTIQVPLQLFGGFIRNAISFATSHILNIVRFL